MKALALPLALICLTAPGFAQTEMVEVDEDVEITAFGLDADDAEDLDVHDEAGNEIGEVEEVLGRDRSTAEALVIEFDDEDSFGDDERVVPLDLVTRTEDGVRLGADVDIEALPAWDD